MQSGTLEGQPWFKWDDPGRAAVLSFRLSTGAFPHTTSAILACLSGVGNSGLSWVDQPWSWGNKCVCG